MANHQMQISQKTPTQTEYALQYLKLGWNLVMMAHGTKGPSHDGWNSPSELVNTPERVAQKMAHAPMNMGLIHQPSGTCAIDVDDEAWTRVILEEFGIDLDHILSLGPRILSKSGRAKVLFRAPTDLKLVKITWPKPGASRATEITTILELRSGPNQDVLPPSLHPDGHLYQWAEGQTPWDYKEIPEIPEILLDFWRSLEDTSGTMREEIKALCPWRPVWEAKRVKSPPRMASQEHQDVIGKYNDATDIESLLNQSGYKCRGKRWLAPSSSSKIPGLVVFKDGATPKCYSHHGSDPLADGFAHDAFDLLCILQHNGDFNAAMHEAAILLGVERVSPKFAPDVVLDLDAILLSAHQKKKALNTPKVKSEPVEHAESHSKPTKPVEVVIEDDFPAELLNPPGVLGELTQWILDCAQKPQPVLALGSAISIAATALAQKVESHTGLRTNLYLVCVGDTSAGKDHGRKCLKVALQSAGMAHMIGGEEIASGQGLLARVGRVPTSVFQPDEFGMWLKALGSKSAGPHQASIITNLMKLFSSAGTIYMGSEYANQDERKRVDIEYPCVNLHATTTPEPLFEAFGSADIASGNLNRLLILFSPSARFPMLLKKVDPPSDSLIAWLKAARTMHNGMAGMTPANPITMHMDAGAERLFGDLYEFQQDKEEEKRSTGMHHLWGRCFEHASKLAMVVACAKHSSAAELSKFAEDGQLRVDAESARWAIKFVKYVMTKMEREVSTRVADSDFERTVKQALGFIEKAGLNGLTHRELSRSCRSYNALDPRSQDSIMDSLKRREDVLLVQYKPQSGRGKSRMAWVSSRFEADVNVQKEAD